MKKLEILQELPKCDTETWCEQMMLENGTNSLAQHGVAAKLQFVKKNVISTKCIKAKHNKAKYVCIGDYHVNVEGWHYQKWLYGY